MGYNISDTGGETTGTGLLGTDSWEASLQYSGDDYEEISGDFSVSLLGYDLGDAESYSVSALSTDDYGTLSFDEDTGEYTFTVDWNAVLASGADQTVSFTVTGSNTADLSGLGTYTASDSDTITINLALCFARGTLIDTDEGPRPVEDLALGDSVSTVDSGSQKIRWKGHITFSAAELRDRPHMRPVIISAGALGPDLPRRDIAVSPQHRILIAGLKAEVCFGHSEVLVPAKALINGDTIRQFLPDEGVEYFHLMLPRHEILEAEGLQAESFHPGNYAIENLTPEDRAEMLQALAEGDYYKMARPVITVRLGRVLAPIPATAPRRVA